jgi:hypothetical protein
MKQATAIFLLFVVLAAAASATAAGRKGTRANPYPFRAFGPLPQSRGWKLRVNKTIPNASRAVTNWNKYNAPPRAGDQYFMINVSLGYSGVGVETPRFPPESLAVLGRSRITYTTITDSCGSVPGALNFGWRVRSGSSVSGNICFSVSKADVRGLLLKFESVRSLHPQQVFFKLP